MNEFPPRMCELIKHVKERAPIHVHRLCPLSLLQKRQR
nr:MAG TPA: hypothetical protein [Caudoviricetes sp.]